MCEYCSKCLRVWISEIGIRDRDSTVRLFESIVRGQQFGGGGGGGGQCNSHF